MAVDGLQVKFKIFVIFDPLKQLDNLLSILIYTIRNLFHFLASIIQPLSESALQSCFFTTRVAFTIHHRAHFRKQKQRNVKICFDD